MNPRGSGRRGGFTLIEVMLTVALVAVLVSLATPGYRQFVNRAHRTDAIAHMLRIASCQERVRALAGAYDLGRCLPAPQPRYSFEYAEDSESGYVVMAHPVGAQAADPCGTLILEHTGGRSVGTPQADPNRCWSGR